MGAFARNLRPHVAAELRAADKAEARGEPGAAFAHLERAHVLGQAATVEHVRVHWRMLRWGRRHREVRECAGQVVRLVGASAKTALGRVPRGNTGGANVSPFAPMPIPPDLDARIRAARAAAD
ncbi:MAG: hypothetical protein JWM10_4077 [Myxococcaceae bacterium]|nr:hypothetical protein [Myxococcaceae bacterium]